MKLDKRRSQSQQEQDAQLEDASNAAYRNCPYPL